MIFALFACSFLFQAHGAEILCSKCNSEEISPFNMEEFSKKDVRWQRFKETLTSKGYFKVSFHHLTDRRKLCFIFFLGGN
jgi:hypothetical protein